MNYLELSVALRRTTASNETHEGERVLYVCTACSAIVWDKDRHTTWHSTMPEPDLRGLV